MTNGICETILTKKYRPANGNMALPFRVCMRIVAIFVLLIVIMAPVMEARPASGQEIQLTTDERAWLAAKPFLERSIMALIESQKGH